MRRVDGVVALLLALVVTGIVRLGVRPGPEYITYRGFLRTRRVYETDVTEFVVVDTGNITGAAYCLAATLRDGSVVRFQMSANHGQGGRVGAAARELSARLAAPSGDRVAASAPCCGQVGCAR